MIGTAFYTGVTASSTMMSQNVDAYNDSLNLKDITIYSNYGFEAADIEAVENLEEVDRAEGSKFADVMASDGTTASVTRIHSLKPDSKINQFILVEGRYPENDSEVLAERGNDMDPGYAIGSVLTLTRPDNDLGDFIKTNTVTVVGSVDTPLYLNMTKENSTLGNQYIGTYLYMNDSGFNLEYDTELNAVTKNGKSFNSFYEEYETYMDGVVESIERLSKTQTKHRERSIYDKANSKYEEGLKEYNDGLAEYNSEISRAEKKLSDAYSEIQRGYREINANQGKINKERKKLANAIDRDAASSIEDGFKQIDSTLPKLEAASRISNSILSTMPSLGNLTIEQAEDIASRIYKRLRENEELYDYIRKRPEIAKYISSSDVELIESMLSNGKVDSEYLDMLGLKESDTLKDVSNALDEYVKTINSKRGELEDAKAKLIDAELKISAGNAELDNAQRQLDAARAKLGSGYETYFSSVAEFEVKKADGWQELEDAKAKLDKAQQDIQNLDECTWTILDRSKHYASETFKGTVKQMKAIADIFPVFFLLVAALVCLTTMTRMVDEERGQIGIMRALGYRRLQCAFRYLFYAGSAAIIGCAIGTVIGMCTFPIVIYNAWKMMYILPDMKVYISWSVIAKASVAFIAVILLTTLYTCYRDMMDVPSQLLRPKSPKLGRATLIERVTFLWKRFSFTWKVTVRNLVRYKKRFAMTVIGVAGCTALLVIGFGIKDSIQSMVDLQFSNLLHYDGVAKFEDELLLSEKKATADDILSRDDVKSVQAVTGYSTLVTSGKNEETSNLLVFDNNSQIEKTITLRTRREHEAIKLADDGVVISEKMAENMDISVGDRIEVESKTGLKREVDVSAVCEMYIQHYVFMSKAYYAEIFGTDPGYNEVLITENDKADNLHLQSDLLAMKNVDSISFADSILKNFQQMVDSLDLIVWVLIISSMMLVFVVLGNLTNINISERQREIATLKVLGFRPKEVQSYIYNENNILTIIGSICGLPLGNVLHHYIMRQVEMDYIMFGRSILPQSFIYSVVITILFGLLVNYFTRKKLNSVLMVESLKSVE